MEEGEDRREVESMEETAKRHPRELRLRGVLDLRRTVGEAEMAVAEGRGDEASSENGGAGE